MLSHEQPCRAEGLRRGSRALGSAMGALAALLLATATVAQTPGPNRNVVSGVVPPMDRSDPAAVIRMDLLRQRQNEPVMAPSSTHPEHLLAAANDYRTIDVSNATDRDTGESNDGLLVRALARLVSFLGDLLGFERERPSPPRAAADAWMGVYRSCNRGVTWTGGLLPGSPTDSSPASLVSPLRGLAAATDPVLAPAPDGRAFLGGLAFTPGGTSAVFVARYTDRNDREGGLCFAYDFTRVVETGSVSPTGRFADKPTIAADVTRVKGGNSWRYTYMAYTIFTGNETDQNFRGRIRFTRSADDGVTWSKPVTVSGNLIHNQAAALAVDPDDGDVYIVWRDFVENRILMTRSHDFGARWSVPEPIHDGLLAAFDLQTGPEQFRSNGFPTIAIDGTSRVFVAWQERVNDSGEPDPAGSPRIVMTMSDVITKSDISWTTRHAVDIAPRFEEEVQRGLGGEILGRPSGPQVMPALSANAGELMLVYAESKPPLPGAAGPFSGVEREMDVRVARLDPTTGLPSQPSVQVSEYSVQATEPPVLVETAPGYPARHRPNLPMFRGGHVPFIGDYKFLVAAQPYVRTSDGGWKWASKAGDLAAPSFHAIWTDNRNVQFPFGVRCPEGEACIDGDWTEYAPPGGGSPSCINPGSRDQDIYTSEISNGIVAGTPSLFKPLLRPNGGGPIRRAFVVYVENRTPEPSHVLLHLVPNEDETTASFDQFTSLTTLPPAGDELNNAMEIFPHSTLTRAVYLESTLREGSARFEVEKYDVETGPTGDVLARVVVNESPPSPLLLTNTAIGDSEVHTPRIMNRRVSNPRIMNPGIWNGRTSNATVSNPRIMNPRIMNPALSDEVYDVRDVTFTMRNVGNTTSVYSLHAFIPEEIADDENLEFQLLIYRTTSDVGTVDPSGQCAPVEVLHDEFISSVETPRIMNPRIMNPRIMNPRIMNPWVSNPRLSNIAFYLEPAEGPLDSSPGAAAPASTSAASAEAAFSAAAEAADPGAPSPVVPQVHVTWRIFQIEAPGPGELTLEDIAPEDPTQPPLISTAVVSQATNVVDGVAEDDPSYAVAGPEPPTLVKEVNGEVVEYTNEPLPASGLVFSQTPSSTQVNQAITPPVEVRITDVSGLTVPVTGIPVTVTLGANPGGGSLSGTLTRLSVGGFATFDDLSIDAHGDGYTLLATSPGLASATSAPFDVTVLAPVAPPITTRVSVDSIGGEGYGPDEGCSGGRSITPDGRFVAFDCTFTKLDMLTPDTNGARDVFVRDLQTGTTTRVSVATGGTEGDGDSTFASLSDDGRYVAFQSVATNLDVGDGNWVSDIFVHDRDLDHDGIYDEDGEVSTTRVSVGLTGEADGPSTFPVISGDGETIAFWSDATNLVPDDTNGEPDVFVVDRATLATSRVSVKTWDEQTNAVEGLALPAAPALSRNGRVVAFQSTRADLADQGKVGWRDIYVHDRDTHTTTRVSVASDGTEGTIPKGCGPWDGPEGKFACADFASSNPSLSADGRFVAFDSIYDNLVPNDTNFDGDSLGRDVFVHDRQTGETTLGSVSTEGVQDNTLSETGAPCGTGPHAPTLSPDGRFVTFSSCGSSLVAGDTNGISDAFLHDRFLGTTVRVSVATGGAQVTTDSGAFGTRFTAASTGAQVLAMGSDAERMVEDDNNRYLAAGELGTDIFTSQPLPAPAPPTERYLAFTVQPVDTPERETIIPSVAVAIQDAYGNTDLTATNLITLSVALGPGVLQGTTTVSAVSGVAVFSDLSLTEEGTHTLRATAVGFAGVESGSFTVLPPIAVLAFTIEPVDTEAGAAMATVQVAIQDPDGNTLTTRTDTITLGLRGTGEGVLYGTTSIPAVDGVAAFNDLYVDVVADDYSLEAAATRLDSATSALFDIAVSSAPLTFTVTNTDDAGRGSLRQAMLAANANIGRHDTIEFGIPGAGPHAIVPTSRLPIVTDGVSIDATTQPGSDGVPAVELDGALAGSTLGFSVAADGCVIKGLAIHSFANAAIQLASSDAHTIDSNYLGTNSTGDQRLGNGYGVETYRSSNNVISNNVISGNTWEGVFLRGGDANRIEGNVIGLDPQGIVGLPNERDGIVAYPSPVEPYAVTNLVVRGNVISGNQRYGVNLVRHTAEDPRGAESTRIMGNIIGLNVAGATAGNILDGVITNSASGTIIGSALPADANIVAGNTGSGIVVDGPGAVPTVIQGNRIGTDPTGTEARPNDIGVYIRNSPGNLIGGTENNEGNLISGNSTGVRVWGPATNGTILQGNLVGTNADGSAPLGNTNNGVAVGDAAATTLIGGTVPGAGNVISANHTGVVIGGGDAVVQGNFIGTDSTGMAAIGNSSTGVEIASGATNATIGGTAPGARNVISGNGNRGIAIIGPLATGTVVEGNYIGVDQTGLGDLGNLTVGIQFYQTSNHRIGSAADDDGRNVISGNGTGLLLYDVADVFVENNYIGTNATGTAAIGNDALGVNLFTSLSGSASDNFVRNNLICGNGEALRFSGSVSNNTIEGNRLGQSDVGEALPNTFGIRVNGGTGTVLRSNRIEYTDQWGLYMCCGAENTTIDSNVVNNNGQGVLLASTTGTGNTITSNHISSNGGLGIDLGADGVTLNDGPGDADEGPNNLQNFPVVDFVVSDSGAGTTRVGMSLDSTPDTTFAVEAFRSSSCDPSGYGEAETTILTTSLSTDAVGHASGSTTFAGAIPIGSYVTLTATDPDGNTSEFSACRQVAAPVLVFDSFDAGGTFSPDTSSLAASGQFNSMFLLEWSMSATRFTMGATDARLTAVTLPIAFWGASPGELRVSLAEESAGGTPGSVLEVLSENELYWPERVIPFSTTTTLLSSEYPLLSAGESYWIITEPSQPPSPPMTFYAYEWFQSLTGPSLRVITEGYRETGGGYYSSEGLSPRALRIEGVPVP